ncbi:MAG: hypothetical protein DHS20C17_29060 [Cyclobacteriaceae bacterium]|nr:MAG: hypothetical protein DHS20C17_29060 [Cyclobacteriaceae bacterium]
MKVVKIQLIISIGIALIGCLDPYNPDISDGQQAILVVDGIITDQPGPYTVKIMQSSSLNSENIFTQGLEVTIEEENGPSELLVESSPGIYQTNNLQGVVGKSYRLAINNQGQRYESSWETIYASPAIDSIYFEAESRATTDKEIDQTGIQFFVDNHGAENGVRYFRYEWEETWQLGVNWRSGNDYLGNDMVAPTSNPVWRCWKNRSSTSINLGTTQGLSKNVLSGHRLDFIPSNEERFTERYSLLLKQYALQEKEYRFWKNLQESNEELGSLFDKQPANVVGNITNVTDPGVVVLGYFSAAGSQEVRLYLDVQDVPGWLSKRPACPPPDQLLKADYIPRSDYEPALIQRLEAGLFINFIYSEFSTIPIGALVSSPRCSDCTFKGGDLNKPDFWDE